MQRAARHRGASFIDSEEWYAELKTRRRKETRTDEATSKPTATPTEGELSYWLERFGDSSNAETESDELFPPGYGDDVEE